MQLIKKVEINYLRSIYSTVLDATGDLNLFFGRNDSGKSNILRALNLFFNGQSDPGSDFDFELDLSDLRKKRAAEAKGRQFVWIKITFNVPQNFQRSLGREISVKKQWNRYGGDVHFSSSPALSGGKASILTRFLNQIDFTYVPAIKDLEVYADLIERMYSSASENKAMLAATEQFIEAIGAQTETLTGQLRKIFSSKTSLSAPADMAVLFRNLDFAHGDDGHSLFKQKGDGIKARHLPELLRFINENELSKRFYLWGFEEPENSLDLSAATTEAKRFAEFSSRTDTQIFISSHSPAFYLAPSYSESTTRRYFVEKQAFDENGEVKPERATAKIDNVEDADRIMRTAGLMQLPYVIQALRDQQKALSDGKAEIEALNRQLSDLSKPTLFVEGKHDLTAYPQLLSAFGIKSQFDVKQLAGTPKNTKDIVGAITSAGGLSSTAKSLFLFDNDNAGRGSLTALAGKHADTSGLPVTIGGGNVSAAVLPFRTKSFLDFIASCDLPEGEIKFPFELLFMSSKLLEFVDLRTADDSEWRESIHDDYHKKPQKITNRMRKYPSTSPGWLYARMVPNNLKSKYLEMALSSPNTSCDALQVLVHTIGRSLDLSDSLPPVVE